MRDNPFGIAGLAFGFFLTICVLDSGPALAQQDMVSLVRQSGFVFAGKIEKLGAATAGLHAASDTAVVRVVRVIDRRPPIDEIEGHAVTVRLLNAKEVRTGQEAVFFTYLYGGGQSLGLVEVAQLPDQGNIDQSVHDARAALADGALKARLDSASVVATAKVLRTARVEAASPRGEHEPMWWTATLEVAAVFKGDTKKGALITVLYPSNYDAVWGASPKPKPGEIAIFLMQPPRVVPTEDEESGERGELKGLFLVDHLDEIDLREAERVRGLLAR